MITWGNWLGDRRDLGLLWARCLLRAAWTRHQASSQISGGSRHPHRPGDHLASGPNMTEGTRLEQSGDLAKVTEH